MPRLVLLLMACAVPAALGETGASLGARIHEIRLDPSACYRVRDLTLQREEARIYLTDGLLIFSKPLADKRVVAVFQTVEPSDDGEVLVRVPNRSERASLAAATGSPTMDEHFRSALFIFTDDSGAELIKQIESGRPKPDPESGAVLADKMEETVRHLADSFQVRLVQDLLTGEPTRGMFYAAFSGKTLNSFDLLYDPTLPEQIILGQISSRSATEFDIWTSFQTSRRRRAATAWQEDVTARDYRINARLQPDLMLEVTTRATLVAHKRVGGAVAFELAPQMQVASASLDGKPVEVFRHESMREALIGGRPNEPFLVVLPAPLEAGSKHEVVFEHAGKVIRPAGNNVFFVGARTNWYPSRGFDFTTYDLTFKVPRMLRVVATGDSDEVKEEGDWRVVHFRTTAPVRLAGFNVGAYESTEIRRSGFRVLVCANRTLEPALQGRPPQMVVLPPAARGPMHPSNVMTVPGLPNPEGRLFDLASEIASAMEWMASKFGPPPLRTLSVSPIPGHFGQGFPGLLYLSTVSFLSDKDRPSNLQSHSEHTFFSEILHAHETAHQWWGNLVTAATYHDEWLMEALANYSALLILEKKMGPRALETTLDEYREELRLPQAEPGSKIVESAGPITWGLRLRTLTGVDPWRVITYDKGSWIMHMLRRRMGDEAFLAMLGAIRKRFSYLGLSTDEFREIAAEFSPQGLPDPTLEDFFDTWVYATGLPVLEMTSSVKGKAPDVELTLKVRQSGVSADFGADVPVEIRLPGQAKPQVEWIRTETGTASMTVKLPAAPSKVEFAPGYAVLYARK